MPMNQADGAVLDVGTNSIKILCASWEDKQLVPVYEDSIITRLGEGLEYNQYRLREGAMRRTIEGISELVKRSGKYYSGKIAAVGTSALREAHNSEEFLQRVNQIAGIDIEIIPGEEEARFSYIAVRDSLNILNADNLCVVDIGGGSTEIINGDNKRGNIKNRVSIPVGAVKLTDQFLRSDPATVQQITAAQGAVQTYLSSLSHPESDSIMVGVGGTVTNLANLVLQRRTEKNSALHGLQIDIDELEREFTRLAVATVNEKRTFPGLDPERADIILGGAVLLLQVMTAIGSEQLIVSTKGLRWGVFYDRYPCHIS